MTRIPRRRSAAVLLAMAASLAVPPQAQAAPADTPSPQGEPRTVTLVTGDRVTVVERENARPVVTVERGPGRRHTGFTTEITDGRIVVTPEDARPLVAQGRLDSRLFDVTQLLASGYDDEHRARLPLITKGSAVRSARAIPGSRLGTVDADKRGLASMWRSFTADPSAKLWLDGKMKASLDVSVPQIGAPAAWARGLTGKGVRVAVLDTGVDAGHPDLKEAVKDRLDFTTSGSVEDRAGHGTHVASILAGSGAASGGGYRGVAPGAELVSGKVLGDNGEGQESWIIAGMTWAAREAKARVINMSLGCFCDSPAVDPVEAAVNDLSEETGALFVASVGNVPWPASGLVALPAAAEGSLAVSSVDRGDNQQVTAQGPVPGTYAIKPELLAPGQQITAARAAGTSAGTPVDDHYTRLTGTSMATPHVAGAAAILAQQHPGWNGERIKATLMAAAKELPGVGVYTQGAGRVDVAKASAHQVSAAPGSVNVPLLWPGSGDTSELAKKVTYANSGDEPVELSLGLALTGPNRLSPPAGAVTLGQDRVTVPAGGESTVTLTFRGIPGIEAGLYTGHLTAKRADGTTAVRTPVGGYLEPPTAAMTFHVLNRDGDREPFPLVTLRDLDTGRSYDASGWYLDPAKARVPRGRYLITSHVSTGNEWQSIVVQKATLEPGAHEITLDARQTTPVELTHDRADAELSAVDAVVQYSSDKFWFAYLLNGDATQRISVTPMTDPNVNYSVTTMWEKRGATLDDPSPYMYRDLRYVNGGVPADPGLHTRDSGMARIDTTVRFHGGPGTHGQIGWSAHAAGDEFSSGMLQMADRRLPARFTLHLRPDDPIRWQGRLQTYVDPANWRTQNIRLDRFTPRRYRPGRYVDAWNAAVIAPRADFDERAGDRVEITGHGSTWTSPGEDRGRDQTTSGTLRLSKDGTVLGETTFTPLRGNSSFRATLPPEAATYTLLKSLERQSTVSPKVESLWTFRSARPGSAEPVGLPLTAVRFLPAGLNDRNQAPKGRPTVIPVWVERASGAPGAAPKSLRVEASFDDGATWRPVPFAGRPGAGAVTVIPPDTASFVSLRATAVDAAGDQVVQTVVRAYELR
ncbi:S8 family serine peptidase [Actinomadura fulvescens]|uniref:S8 family serine peptidase n=1 Tax=Actinomadura fulvescens TaxID=46160 RepID=A0ABP6BX68_9ACTN